MIARESLRATGHLTRDEDKLYTEKVGYKKERFYIGETAAKWNKKTQGTRGKKDDT